MSIDFSRLIEDIDPKLLSAFNAEISQDEFAEVYSRLSAKLWYIMGSEIPNCSPGILVLAVIYASASFCALPAHTSPDKELYAKDVVASFASAINSGCLDKSEGENVLKVAASVGRDALWADLSEENTAALKEVAALLNKLRSA